MNSVSGLRNLLLGLSIVFYLTACGGGGGDGSKSSTPTIPVASSSSLSSVEASSSSESLMSSSASADASSAESSHSESSSSSALPTHTSNGSVYCTPSGTDPDGDGWGWENNATCIVRNSAIDPDKGHFQGCIIGTGSWNYCSVDNTSWGFENNTVCISNSFCPANRSASQTAMSNTLVAATASFKAQAVFDYLRATWGSNIISGQQDLTWDDTVDMYQRVLDDTGKAPAIMGYDFLNYRFSNGSGLQQTEEAIAHSDRGGLVTFSWHWRDPSQLTSEFYSDKTAFQIPIAKGALNPQSPHFAKINNDLDQIAGELKRLQDAGVIVLWRPLHEASGGWFWWGRSRTDAVSPAYAQVVLWRHIYDRMINHHGLTNLIWVWNGQSSAWYPGDAYVDIVSQDIYDTPQDYDSQISSYNTVKNFPLQAKLVALSENSNIPDPDNMVSDGAWWLWFMVWNDFNGPPGVTHKDNFWTGEYYNTNAHKTKVYNHQQVITLDELPAF